MTIDPFTIVAQIFNFVVLMLLLRRFLYGPIVRTMDAREKHITTELDEAERKQREARHEAERLRREREDLEDRRGEFLTQAQIDAEKKHNDLLQQARDEVEARKQAWQDAIDREKESFLRNLRERAGEQVYVITRRVLTDLANVELERFIIDTFIERLGSMEDEGLDAVAAHLAERQQLRLELAAAGPAGEAYIPGEEGAPPEGMMPVSLPPEEGQPGQAAAVITTAFDIDDETRERISTAVLGRLGENVELRFEVIPELICGIELKAEGYKAAWSLQNYLETMDESISLAFAGREAETTS